MTNYMTVNEAEIYELNVRLWRIKQAIEKPTKDLGCPKLDADAGGRGGRRQPEHDPQLGTEDKEGRSRHASPFRTDQAVCGLHPDRRVPRLVLVRRPELTDFRPARTSLITIAGREGGSPAADKWGDFLPRGNLQCFLRVELARRNPTAKNAVLPFLPRPTARCVGMVPRSIDKTWEA